MAEIYAEYNADLLTPGQIDRLHNALVADLDDMAADADGPEAEAG